MAKVMNFAAAILLLVPGLAQAAEPPCLTKTEFSSLTGYALPSIISGTTKRCSTTLGPQAYLTMDGARLAKRYAARKASAWPGAKAAFVKLSAEKDEKTKDVFRKLSDDSLQEMLDVILEGMVSQEIPLEKCGTIDEFVRLLSPLPPENTVELIALTVGLAADSRPAKVGKLTICQS